MRAIGMRTFGIIAASGLTASPAAAQLVLSQVVVDLPPTAPPRVDVEAANGGT